MIITNEYGRCTVTMATPVMPIAPTLDAQQAVSVSSYYIYHCKGLYEGTEANKIYSLVDYPGAHVSVHPICGVVVTLLMQCHHMYRHSADQ